MTREAKNPVKSVERTCEILRVLREEDGARVSELRDRLELSKSTVHSHLATLEQQGYVRKDDVTYRPGIECLTLGGYVRDYEELYGAGREATDELAETTGELAALTIGHDGRSVYLYQASGGQAMTTDSHLGIKLPLHCTATGKAMLAELPDERVEAILDEYGLPAWTDATITDRPTLREELETVRETGISFDDEERIAGMRAVGAPILDDGEVLGAIAVTGPSNRLEDEFYTDELPEQLSKIKRMIEINATYS